MKYVFPEYKENVVLGNGKLQLNPMSYQVIYEGDYSVRFVPRIADNNTYNPWESYQ